MAASKNKTNSKFLKIVCPRCKKITIVYGNSSIEVKCNDCNYLLTKSSGGRAKVRAKVKEIFHEH